MNTQKTTQKPLEEFKVSVRLKLAALWVSFMFLYIYVDYFHLFMPGTLEDMLAGKVFTFKVSQTFLLIVLAAAAIPVLMIFLSLALPAKINRLTNIIVALIHIPYMLFNLAGEAWIHMVLGAVLEVILLGLIIRYAWKWPRMDE
ncbi:DUF6326 family protein [uncultured Fluviicola sp.]|uniref:DUF6326 family protein n=1 Tax=uncultured Fluviicola sp. TaxID=463303 RepID=UPI0025E91402|nr:DUF6326 family protein [uncultured Fluviicola sp.]